MGVLVCCVLKGQRQCGASVAWCPGFRTMVSRVLNILNVNASSAIYELCDAG